MPEPRQYLCETHPEIAADWHLTANGGKTAGDVTAASKFEAVWLCHGSPPHEMSQRVDNRVRQKGCKLCQAQLVVAQNNVLVKFPHIAKEWHPTKNGDLKPQDVQPMSHKRIWWQCSRDPGHVWNAYLHLRTSKDRGCPFCPRPGKRPDESSSLAHRYPGVAAQWHPTKNKELRPQDVFWASNKRVWWQCPAERHVWSATILSRTSLKSGCPYCAEFFLSDKNRLSVQFPELAAEWHPTKNRRLWPKIEGGFKVTYNLTLDPSERDYGSKRKLLPSDVSVGSEEEVWWQCTKSAEHVWKATVLARTKKKERCPFCSGSKASSDNNLAVLYPGLARQWHSRNGSLLPSQVTPVSNKTVWWRCYKNAGHSWEQRIAEVVAAYENGKSSCAMCRTTKPDSDGLELKSG